MNFYLILVLLVQILKVSPWKMKEYPYADLNFDQKVAHDKYPLEQYEVETKDHYYLTIFRIPHGRTPTNSTNRSPVLLIHGMGASVNVFIVLGPGRSLAYSLADSGFDVWLLSTRGAWKSQRHKYYDINKDRQYWKFTIDEISVHDLAVNIDFILEKTKQKPFLIGHSQGNTCTAMLLAEKPEYNKKIKMAVIYAQSINLVVDNVVIRPFIYSVEIIEAIYDLIGADEALIMPNIAEIVKTACKEQSYFITLCHLGLELIGSHHSQLIEKDLVPAIISGISRVSAFQLIHYLQMSKTGLFSHYDYGPKRNIQKYNSSTPPIYDLNKITACISVFYSGGDHIGTVEGTLELIKRLPNVCHSHKVKYEYFNHVDFIFAKNAFELVYKPTIDVFKKYDAEHV